jgi:hypothetical protein
MKRPEESVQRATLKLLKTLPVLCFAVPNGGKRTATEAIRMKKSGGVTAGVPDLILIYKGRTFGLELKRPGLAKRPSALSPAQRHMSREFIRNGAAWGVFDDPVICYECVKAWMKTI